MKRIFLSAASLLTMTIGVNAQITLEKTFHFDQIASAEIVNFPTAGMKLVVQGANGRSAQLYNMDYTLWKTINNTFFNEKDCSNWGITEALFDTDPSTIEILSGNQVIQEDGKVIYEFEGAVNDIVGGNGVYKCITYDYVTAYPASTIRIYSLPGTLPCNDCSNNNNGNTGERPITYESAGGFLSNPIPNPSLSETRIDFMLPPSVKSAYLQIYNTQGALVRSYPLKREERSIKIDVSGMISGTYFYMINTEGAVSSAKKMLVVK